MPWRVETGDCLEVLAELESDSIHACVTDPPYGLSFMGKDWDRGVPGPVYWEAVKRVLKPGAPLLAFGGTRTHHRLMVAIEDAGFELRDTLMWLYGSGFPKSHDISKAIDKKLGAEREVVGPNPNARPNHDGVRAWVGGIEGSAQTHPPITAPATDEAKLWDGWGSALKPAHEPLVWAQKHLTVVPLDGMLLEQVEKLLGGVLCQLLLSVNSVDVLSKSSQSGFGRGSVSALLIAAVLHGAQCDEQLEEMATSNSPEMVSMCLSIVSLWSSILSAISLHGSTFTTSTVTELTTVLRILKSYLSKTIPENIVRVVSLPVGELQHANTAESPLSGENLGSRGCHESFAVALATLHQECISASSVGLSFTEVARVVNTALCDAAQTLNESIPADLSPSFEPVILAMKPLSGTYAQNAVTHGVAGLNIDGCRISMDTSDDARRVHHNNAGTGNQEQWRTGKRASNTGGGSGRWPANVVLDEEAAKLLDAQSGVLKSGKFNGHRNKPKAQGIYGEFELRDETPRCASSGGASRFFYCAKASKSERTGNGSISNSHPTVKPVKLMQWLVRMVSPPSRGIILDPFAGSGTTGIASIIESVSFVGIEIDPDHAELCKQRLRLAWKESRPPSS